MKNANLPRIWRFSSLCHQERGKSHMSITVDGEKSIEPLAAHLKAIVAERAAIRT